MTQPTQIEQVKALLKQLKKEKNEIGMELNSVPKSEEKRTALRHKYNVTLDILKRFETIVGTI